MDGDTLEVLNSIWMPDCSAQAIQAELTRLCLVLTRQPPEQLPHLLRQLRYQFDALAAVDRVPLYTAGGETEISRKDVLSALESRVSQLSAALDRLREETGFPPDRHGVMISGALFLGRDTTIRTILKKNVLRMVYVCVFRSGC